MKVITVEYFGVEGKGNNLKDAKADAARQVQAILRDIETGPKIIALGTLTAVIARTKHGWQYQFTDSTSPNIGYETAGNAERAARLHAAQMLCEIPGDPRRDLIKNESDLSDHMGWFAWQCRYKKLRELGYTDVEAHRLASEIRSMEEIQKMEPKHAG